MSRYSIALGKSPKIEKLDKKIQLVQNGILFNVGLISMHKSYHSDRIDLQVFLKDNFNEQNQINDLLELQRSANCLDPLYDIIYTAKDLKLLVKPTHISWEDHHELCGKIIHIEGSYTVRKSNGITTRI